MKYIKLLGFTFKCVKHVRLEGKVGAYNCSYQLKSGGLYRVLDSRYVVESKVITKFGDLDKAAYEFLTKK